MSIINTTKQDITSGFNLSNYQWINPDGNMYNIQNILKNRVYDLHRIGDKSTYGAVYQVVGTDYLIKIMENRDHYGRLSSVMSGDTPYIFSNEVSVGGMPRIQEVGPRIYAYTRSPYQLIYVMNNVVSQSNTRNGVVPMSLRDYYMKELSSVCPMVGAPIYKSLGETLIKFYKITGGWHGDLHDQNILVLMKGKSIVSVKIIDYGAHRKFSKGVPNCLRDVFTFINDEFDKKRNFEEQNPGQISVYGRMKDPSQGGQRYRRNEEVLTKSFKRINPISTFVKRLINTNNVRFRTPPPFRPLYLPSQPPFIPPPPPFVPKAPPPVVPVQRTRKPMKELIKSAYKKSGIHGKIIGIRNKTITGVKRYRNNVTKYVKSTTNDLEKKARNYIKSIIVSRAKPVSNKMNLNEPINIVINSVKPKSIVPIKQKNAARPYYELSIRNIKTPPNLRNIGKVWENERQRKRLKT